jgi:hypothetical protein
MLRTVFHACAVLFLAAPVALTQQVVPSPAVNISEWIDIVHIPSIPDAPFTATTMMDNIHTLADGTRVTTKTMTTIARDSAGRTHNENRYSLSPADNGEGRIRDITIFDPNTRSKTTVVPATRSATVLVQPAPKLHPAVRAARQEPQREDLGSSEIAGISVHGFRQTHTIPEGREGNDRPITITDEYWYSDELHMNITVKHTDPRHGTQFVTLTQLKRQEPDPKMFEVPPGYTMQE